MKEFSVAIKDKDSGKYFTLDGNRNPVLTDKPILYEPASFKSEPEGGKFTFEDRAAVRILHMLSLDNARTFNATTLFVLWDGREAPINFLHRVLRLGTPTTLDIEYNFYIEEYISKLCIW